ncbi:MAG: hypothetical protein V4671_10875 [Armatimonadota bacterium]
MKSGVKKLEMLVGIVVFLLTLAAAICANGLINLFVFHEPFLDLNSVAGPITILMALLIGGIVGRKIVENQNERRKP